MSLRMHVITVNRQDGHEYNFRTKDEPVVKLPVEAEIAIRDALSNSAGARQGFGENFSSLVVTILPD